MTLNKPVPQNEQRAVCHMCGDPEDHLMGGMPTCINCDTFMGMLTFPEVPRGVYPWIARVQAHCAKLTNAALSQPVPQNGQHQAWCNISLGYPDKCTCVKSQPVPQGEQSQLETKLLTVLQREAASQARHDCKLDKLETELLDTKRALELACDELGNQVDECLQQARNERKGQQNGK